jgi:DNA-binding NarL/FixJ family response regulator
MPTNDHTTGTRGGLRVARKKVLDMLVAGRANQEVARSLGIAVRTVKARVAKLMNKTGTHDALCCRFT